MDTPIIGRGFLKDDLPPFKPMFPVTQIWEGPGGEMYVTGHDPYKSSDDITLAFQQITHDAPEEYECSEGLYASVESLLAQSFFSQTEADVQFAAYLKSCLSNYPSPGLPKKDLEM